MSPHSTFCISLSQTAIFLSYLYILHLSCQYTYVNSLAYVRRRVDQVAKSASTSLNLPALTAPL